MKIDDQMKAKLNPLKENDIKPNFAELARQSGIDYRTIKRYYDGYEGKPATRNNVQLNAANSWNYVWYDLPVYTSYGNIISYSVAEDPVPGYTAEYSGSMNSDYTITNKKRVIPKTDDTFDALKLQAVLLGSMLMAMISSFLLQKTAER